MTYLVANNTPMFIYQLIHIVFMVMNETQVTMYNDQFRITIPNAIAKAMKLSPGKKLQWYTEKKKLILIDPSTDNGEVFE